MSPEDFPWITEHARIIGYFMMAMLGLTLLAAAKVVLQAVQHTGVAVGLRRRIASYRTAREQRRKLQKHGEEILAWEAFHEHALKAIRYASAIRYGDLPFRLAWGWFRHDLSLAGEAARTLPEPLRERALSHLLGIQQAIEEAGPGVHELPGGSSIVMGLLELDNWMLDTRVRHFRKIYRECDTREPDWSGRVKILSLEELEGTSAPPSTPPPSADPPEPTAGS